MNATDLIALFAQRAGLPALQLSPQGTAAVQVDEQLTLNLEHDSSARRLVAYCVVGEVPASGRESLFARLLEANLFARETGGGSLGLDRERNELVLSRVLELDSTDDQAFEAALEQLVDSAIALREPLSAPEFAFDATVPAAMPAFPGALRA